LMFEERLFGLVDILHKVADMFTAEGIPYETIGGMAVAAHIEQVDRDQIMLTRDVDIMIDRSDLERVKEAAPRHGFHFRHSAGLDMLLYGDEKKAIEAFTCYSAGGKSNRIKPRNPGWSRSRKP